jgi:hypothetical protein
MESLGGLPRCTLFCVVGHLIADERCDLTDVEVCQQHRDDDLCRSETADTAAVGGFQVLGTLGLHLGVQRLGAVSGMGVEGVPFLGAVVEGLLLSADFRGVEGDGLLGTDFVGEVRHVLLVDGRQYLFFFSSSRSGQVTLGLGLMAGQRSTMRPSASGFSFSCSWNAVRLAIYRRLGKALMVGWR